MSDELVGARVKIDLLSYGLFAYLYQHYKDSKTSVYSVQLPVQADFDLPEGYDEVLGNSHIAVNQSLRPYLRHIFDEAGVKSFCTEESFKDFVKSRFSRIPLDNIEVAILSMCAFVSELNLYCFQRNCFRFADFAPYCLIQLFLEIEDIKSYFESVPGGAFRSPKSGFKKIKAFCDTMLKQQKKKSDHIPGQFYDIRLIFEDMLETPVNVRAPMKSAPIALAEGEKGDEASNVNLNLAQVTTEKCTCCREENCSLYLQEFKRGLRQRIGGLD